MRQTNRKQTDREQCRLAEKDDPNYIFIILRAILSRPTLCHEISNEITITKPLVRSQFVAVS